MVAVQQMEICPFNLPIRALTQTCNVFTKVWGNILFGVAQILKTITSRLNDRMFVFCGAIEKFYEMIFIMRLKWFLSFSLDFFILEKQIIKFGHAAY